MTQKPTEGRTSVQNLVAGPNDAGQRLDNFLMKHLPGVPKSAVYRLVRSGQVRVNSGRVKPDRRLAEGDKVRVPPVRMADRDQPVRPPDAVLDRLRAARIFEDDRYLALDKPAGLASHGGSGLLFGVIEAVRAFGTYEYVELCHRLDRDTSGVLLLAKSRPALLRAQAAFRDGHARKRYLALLCGRWEGGPRDVDSALMKNRLKGGERFVLVDDEGKPSKSRFTPVQRFREATLCEVDIFSGRMHQIRVHAADIGHPVAGDRKYGQVEDKRALRQQGLKRTFLHAASLRLPAADGLPDLQVEAPLPAELADFLKQLGSARPA
ncbi:MAG TPA: RluA family pseudouridine synthase [Candidatus Binatia bacterium]|nr:RluA family pseudouridine synthase [Candidatus Binatia bacterium]